MRESEVKNIIAVEILDRMNDQGGANERLFSEGR